MIIISKDNFGMSGEMPGRDDRLIASGVDPYYADAMVQGLIKQFCDHDDSPRFFEAKPDDYKLRIFEP